MSLFNFFKPDSKRNAQPENIDEIFELASKDPSYRPLFYRTILEMDLYVLIYPDSSIPTGESISQKDTKLQVRTLKDGKIPLFTSKEKIFDNGVIKEQVNYVALKGKVIFEMFKNAPTILLNPYSRLSKEFLPDEIKKLRDGELFKADEERLIKTGTNMQLGVPANYPNDLVAALKKYCDTREEIKGGYLALITELSSNEPPHILIGLDLMEDNNKIFGEVAEVIRTHIPKGEAVDMMNVAGNNITAQNLRQQQFKVY